MVFVQKFLKTLMFILIFTLQACKVAGTRRPVEGSPKTTVMSYFVSEQYQFETPGFQGGAALSNALSSLYGVAFVADIDTATFSNLSTPQAGCVYASGEGLVFEPKRSVDIGTFRLSGIGLNEVEVPKDQESVSQSIYGSLQAGDYQLENSGVQGNLSFSQGFKVPSAGRNIKVYSGQTAVQTLPTPIIASSEDPNYNLIVSKTESLTIEFEAPTDATYVRVRLTDGTSKPESNVTCYGPTDKPIQIMAGGLNFFRSTDDGTLYIDFVNVSLKTNVEKIKESIVVSYSRHVHGLVDFYLENIKQTAHFGILRFE